jgi:hypothetical protein
LIPWTTAAAYLARPPWCAHRGRLLLVLHVAHFDQNRRVLRKIQTREIGPAVETVGAAIGRRRQPGGCELARHDLGQPHRGTGLGVVERRVRIVDVKPAAIRRTAVGVNADDRVGAKRVGHRGALIYAGTKRIVIAARHRRAHTKRSQFLADAQHHFPVEAVFGIARIRGGSRRLAFLGTAGRHLPVD